MMDVIIAAKVLRYILHCKGKGFEWTGWAPRLLKLDVHTKQSDGGKLSGVLVWYIKDHAFMSEGLHYNLISGKRRRSRNWWRSCTTTKRKCPKSLPLVSVQKKNKMSGLQIIRQPARGWDNNEILKQNLAELKLRLCNIRQKQMSSDLMYQCVLYICTCIISATLAKWQP